MQPSQGVDPSEAEEVIEKEEVDSVKSNEEALDEDEKSEEAVNIEEKFGLKGINNTTEMQERLKEVQANFYNRLESAKLIKRQGKIPFTEHMTVSGESAVEVPTGL